LAAYPQIKLGVIHIKLFQSRVVIAGAVPPDGLGVIHIKLFQSWVLHCGKQEKALLSVGSNCSSVPFFQLE
jgi:hypothetical protein